MASSIFCDGVRRRDFVKVGALGGLGLHLAGYLRLAEAGQVAPAKGRSAIYIYLQGGPSHLDTFDLKPGAPAEIRGEFKPIKTNVSGIEICEHLPKLAQCADKYTILRGVSHTLGAHNLGTDYINTGNRPTPAAPRLSELRRRGQPRNAGREGVAGRRRDTEHESAARLLGRPIRSAGNDRLAGGCRKPFCRPAAFRSPRG